jgi:hypothetical protein
MSQKTGQVRESENEDEFGDDCDYRNEFEEGA